MSLEILVLFLTFETIEQSRDTIISNSSLIYESVTNESVTSILPSIRNAYDLIYLFKVLVS